MRARLARPRRITRGRLVAPVAVAAAVALVGGVVVASPTSPTVRDDVHAVSLDGPAFEADASFTFNLAEHLAEGEYAGMEITDVTGLPEGVQHEGNGVISGTMPESGDFEATVVGTVNGETETFTVPITTTNTASGSTAAVQGSLGEAQVGGEVQAGGGAQAGGEFTTGSEGTDAILGVVAGIVSSLGGDAGSVTELAAGSTGQGDVTPGEDGPETETPNTGSLGLPGSSATAEGEATGDATGGLNTESLGPLGSLIDGDTETGSTTDGTTDGTTQTGSMIDGDFPGSTTDAETGTGGEGTAELTVDGDLSIPGSTSPLDTGSLGALAPGLAFTGAALLGLAGLSLVLNGGSSGPGGSSALLPALPGSTTTGGTTTGGSLDAPGSSGTGSDGSSRPVTPTVAAGAPQAPGPEVANGRG